MVNMSTWSKLASLATFNLPTMKTALDRPMRWMTCCNLATTSSYPWMDRLATTIPSICASLTFSIKKNRRRSRRSSFWLSDGSSSAVSGSPENTHSELHTSVPLRSAVNLACNRTCCIEGESRSATKKIAYSCNVCSVGSWNRIPLMKCSVWSARPAGACSVASTTDPAVHVAGVYEGCTVWVSTSNVGPGGVVSALHQASHTSGRRR
mmetsp:Transcript_139996/g.243773  ORF Transcript_139996/g.243773 Transcript_139996/m.243773 type:complete len:208 (-) Transcript_139996:509-1132(-)